MIRRIVALLCVSGVMAAVILLTPTFGIVSGAPAVPQNIKIEAQDLSLVCPGPIFKTRTGANVGAFTQSDSAFLYYSVSDGSSVTAKLQQQGGVLAELVEASGRRETRRPLSLFAHDSDVNSVQGSRLLNSNQLQKIDTNWAAGLLGASCQRPGSDQWLLGGDTRTSRESLVVLVNPTDVDSTVDLQLLASNGFVSASGLSSISVPKHATTVVPVNGIAPDVDVFAVHVTSRGGAIAAWLQHRAVRGTQAAGVDFVSPSSDASKELVIPGLLIRGAEGAAEIINRREDFSDITNIVRIANSSAAPATVMVRVIGSDAKTFGTVVQAEIPANSISDLPLGSLADGDYSIFVSSDQPVRASAKLNRFNRAVKPISDFAWLPAVSAEAGERAMAVPTAGIPKLVIANPGKSTATVTLSGAGASGSYVIKAGGLRSILVTGGSLKLTSEEKLSATLIVDVNSSIAALPLVEYRNLGNQIKVAIK